MARRPSSAAILWPGFVPPHCPRADCPAHIPGEGPAFTFNLAGTFPVKCRPERIQRFLCHVCRHTFSTQTFATDYCMKRPELLLPTVPLLVLAPADRQIAHFLDCAPSTPSRLVPRIGQHLELFHAQRTRGLTLREPVAFDDFESSVTSQLTAEAFPTAVGQVSWFIYDLDEAVHFAGGKLSARKREEKRQLLAAGTQPERGGRTRAFRRVLDRLLARTEGTLHLVSDAHPVYAAVIARHPERARIRHDVHQNPRNRSKDRPRTEAEIARDRAMFAIDQLHRLMRHSKAHDRRETIAFARARSMAVYRQVVMLVWRNYVKAASERKPRRGTPAMKLGLETRPLEWAEIFSRRIFPRHVRPRLAMLSDEAFGCRLATRGRIPAGRHRPARAH
jgi:hypothetical protein